MKKIICTVLVMIMIIFMLPNTVNAQDQMGENPYVLNPERETDNLEMLTAASAERPDAVTIFNAGVPKHFWVDNFGGRSDDYLEWTVQSNQQETTPYYAWLHLSASKGTEFKISVIQGESTTETNYTKQVNGWEVSEFGILNIPSGTSKIRLTKTTAQNQNCSVKGLDMIRESDRSDYLSRAEAYKLQGQDTKAKFSSQDYGLFFQYGVWGYPQNGPKKSMEDATNDFDVDDFTALLKNTDAKFVIWSVTWMEYKMQMPVRAVDDIMGNSELTAERNLIGEIAEKCKEEGIDFYLYYHQGMQQEPSWKNKQNWPDAEFTKYGTGDRSVFFENWQKVVSEIGTTLGSNLDGWFFDDGCVYYPAPFEKLSAAAKAGNEKRLISFNSWQGTKITEFQDMTFGEGTWGDAADTTDGIFNSGKEKGMLQVGMPMLNRENWGVSKQNESITLAASADQIIEKVRSAHERKVPMALNVMMWEEGVIGDTTFDALVQLKDAMQGKADAATSWVNDDDPQIVYSENSGWETLGKVYTGYYQTDCHKTGKADAEPVVEYKFTGTGIGVVSNRASWAKDCKVYIDGEEKGTAVFNGAPEAAQHEGFSVRDLEYGEHTIRLEYLSDKGSEAQFDAFKIYNDQTEEEVYPVTSVKISSSSTVMASDGEMQLTAIVKPQYAANKEVLWSVTDVEGNPTNLAVIDENGLLKGTAEGYGKVRVTASSKENGEKMDTLIISLEALPKQEIIYGNDEAFERTGSWTIRKGTSDSDETGAASSLSFEGNFVEWYGVMGDDHGRAKIYLDGEYVTTVDCYSEERKEDTLLFRSEDLGRGQHTITIEVDSLKNDYAANYYIEIYKIISETSPITEQVEEITTDPLPGTYDSAQSVTLSTNTEGAVIYYTTDGSTPDVESETYENPIEVNETTTVTAFAVKDGMLDSEIGTFLYEIKSAGELPEDPGDKPQDPGDKPQDPGDKPQDPGDKPQDPGDKPQDPGDKPQNPGEQPQNPGDKPQNPGDRPVKPGVQPQNPDNQAQGGHKTTGNANVPKTGDGIQAPLFAALSSVMVLAVICGICVVIYQKRGRRSNSDHRK